MPSKHIIVSVSSSPSCTSPAGKPAGNAKMSGDHQIESPSQEARIEVSAVSSAAIPVDSVHIDLSSVNATVGSAFPFQKVTIVWKDLKYIVPNPAFSKSKTVWILEGQDERRDGLLVGFYLFICLGTFICLIFPTPSLKPLLPLRCNRPLIVRRPPPRDLVLLQGITGWAEPGKLTALMGGSGAGKTTLMDCIAGRKTIGEITVSIE